MEAPAAIRIVGFCCPCFVFDRCLCYKPCYPAVRLPIGAPDVSLFCMGSVGSMAAEEDSEGSIMGNQEICEGLSVVVQSVKLVLDRLLELDWLNRQDLGVTSQKNDNIGSVINDRISLNIYDESDIWFLRILRGSLIK